MITYRFEETIERSADDAWAYAVDITRHPEWMGVTAAQVVDGRPTEVGATGRETIRMGPRRYEATFVVSEAEPGRRIAWRIVGGAPVAGEVRLDLEPIGPQQTRAIYSGSMALTGPWRWLERLMAGEIRKGVAAELARLKAALEPIARSVGSGA